jgi:hypothetical protein
VSWYAKRRPLVWTNRTKGYQKLSILLDIRIANSRTRRQNPRRHDSAERSYTGMAALISFLSWIVCVDWLLVFDNYNRVSFARISHAGMRGRISFSPHGQLMLAKLLPTRQEKSIQCSDLGPWNYAIGKSSVLRCRYCSGL